VAEGKARGLSLDERSGMGNH